MKHKLLDNLRVEGCRAQYYIENDVIYAVYPKWADFIHDVFTTSKKLPTSASYRHQPFTKGFHGIEGDIDTVEKAVKDHWEVGTKVLGKVRASLPTNLYDKIVPPMDYVKDWSTSLDSGVVSVDRYLQGEVECFIREEATKEISAGSKLITIAYATAQSCFVNPEFLASKGVLVYGLVEHLESLGYSTQVVCIDTTTFSGGSADCQFEVVVKEFGELFDQHKMLIALVAPFMLRGLMFIAEDLIPSEIARMHFNPNGGYGRPVPIIPKGGLVFEQINPISFEELREKFSDQVAKHLETLEGAE